MQERTPRPALDLSEKAIPKIQEKDTSETPLFKHYLAFLREQQGKLCTIEELQSFHQTLQGGTPDHSHVREVIKSLRQRLPEGARIVTLSSGNTGRMYGVVLLPQDKEITSLSQVGVSIFKDEPGKLKVIPRLSPLSKKELEKNPQVEPNALIFLFDALGKENKRHLQTPRLRPTHRKLLAYLVGHPEGVSANRLLTHGLGIDFRDQAKLSFFKDIRKHCRERMVDSDLAIYYTIELSLGETKFFLMNKQKIGKRLHVPIVEEDELNLLPEGITEVVDGLCNWLTVQNRGDLKSLVTPTQRRLLLYLARNFETLCSKEELVNYVFQGRPVPESDFKNIVTVKNSLQKALEGSSFCVFTLFDRPAAFVLLPKDHFQAGKEEELAIVSRQDLAGLDERIRGSILKICNRVRVNDRRLYPVLSGKKREILLELAASFPQGCRSWALTKEFFPNSASPEKTLRSHINEVKRIISREFGDEKIKIKYLFDEYRLQVPYKG